jgi:tRNA (guanine37-N1)-methyltransferase
MNIKVFTIFPEMIGDFCDKSLLGKALKKNLWNLNIVDIRDYSTDKHKKVDDTQYGGEQGLIMRPDVLGNALDKNCKKDTKIIYQTPRGKLINQEIIRELYKYRNDLAIICGRYEGIDERVIEEYSIEELSIGDFVIMGGELPTLMLIEALVRCVDNVVGDPKSVDEDSFGGNSENKFNNLLEFPLYTKPQSWKGREVPKVLTSGDHKKIEEWKLKNAEEITKTRRKDLWNKYIKQNNISDE